MEESKTLPTGVVWEEFRSRITVPTDWMQEVRDYESRVLSKRS